MNTNAAQLPTKKNNSFALGGKIRINPRPLMSEEKLDTQNGIRNSRNVCHWLAPPAVGLLTLRSNANPMTALIPRELIQIAGVGSKYMRPMTRYQMR
jgi:hypothetical protein